MLNIASCLHVASPTFEDLNLPSTSQFPNEIKNQILNPLNVDLLFFFVHFILYCWLGKWAL
jgi:hypothetical protein